jgi:hypothetical protein
MVKGETAASGTARAGGGFGEIGSNGAGASPDDVETRSKAVEDRGGMRAWLKTSVGVLGLLTGCRAHAPAPLPAPRQPVPSVGAVAAELPLARAARTEPDLRSLAKTPVRPVSASDGVEYRRLTESACQALAAKHTQLANALDDEGRVPPKCADATDALQQTVRFHAALELRNTAAAEALERFFQLAEAEGQADLLRQAFPVLDDLIAKAKAARAANVRFPLDPADLEHQRSQTLTQLERAESGGALLNIDLKRRLGRAPESEPLWPSGEFGIDSGPSDVEAAVNAALADRPELRGLRAVYVSLVPDTLMVAREALRAGNPLLGASPPAPRGLLLLLKKRGPDPEALAEVEVRRKQLAELIDARERAVADEARAAVVALNAQTRRVQLARDRLDGWAAKRAEAIKKREANQPGAELLEAQVTLEWQKARAEAVSEVMAWHQARVRLKAAQGWLAWETLGTK